MEFEPSYNDIANQHVSLYEIETPPWLCLYIPKEIGDY